MAAPKGYKQTELGVIPEDWEVVNLGANSLAQFDYDNIGTGTLPDYVFNYITLENIDNGKLLETIPSKFSVASPRARRIVHQNDILIATVRPLLHSHYYASTLLDDTICSTGFCVIATDESRLCGKYLYHLFFSDIIDKQIKAIITGSNYPAINSNDIKGLIIPFPPLSEQHAIAIALSDMDGYIASLEKLIAKKKAIKQGAMQELLTGKRRLPGFTGEWKEQTLACISENIIMGQSPSSKYYNSEGKGLPLIQGNADIDNRKTIIRMYTSQITKEAVKGDIILTVRAPVGNVAQATFNCCLGRGVCAISSNNDYLYHWFIYFELKWSLLSSGSTFDSINGDELRKITLHLPSNETEQSAIAAVLSDMGTEIEALTAKLNKVNLIKQGAMQELLTGRIRLVKPKAVTVPTARIIEIQKHKKALNGHNQAIEDAVILGVVTDLYATKQYPLAPFYSQKFPYLLHRHIEGVAKGFEKKAAGPYNPSYRYKTALPIALRNKYVIGIKATYEGHNYLNLITGNDIDKAKNYFIKWYGEEPLKWLKQFCHIEIKNRHDELELLTTVDMAMVELRKNNKLITMSAVKEIIKNSEEWKAKLKREIFSDENISRAIAWSIKLFGEEE